MRLRLKVGDVFTIPLGDGRAGVGQVVGMYGKASYYFAVFDLVLPLSAANERAVEALSGPVAFLALSMDGKLFAGHWIIIGNAPVRDDIPLPAYQVDIGYPPEPQVEDYSGTLHRRATPIEAQMLRYRETVAPVFLERALRASQGLEPWTADYDDLRADGIVTTADIFG